MRWTRQISVDIALRGSKPFSTAMQVLAMTNLAAIEGWFNPCTKMIDSVFAFPGAARIAAI
jgi:hypothetical protein